MFRANLCSPSASGFYNLCHLTRVKPSVFTLDILVSKDGSTAFCLKNGIGTYPKDNYDLIFKWIRILYSSFDSKEVDTTFQVGNLLIVESYFHYFCNVKSLH